MEPSVVHLSLGVAPVGHEIAAHAPLAHCRSHLQASLQLMSAQAPAPEQLIEHFDPPAQLTSLQAPSPMQLIVQVQPVGQLTLPQLSAFEHSMVQVFAVSLHVVQSEGQFWITQ